NRREPVRADSAALYGGRNAGAAIPYWMRAGARALRISRAARVFRPRAYAGPRPARKPSAHPPDLGSAVFARRDALSEQKPVRGGPDVQGSVRACPHGRLARRPRAGGSGGDRSRNLYRRPGFRIASADGGGPRCAWRSRNRRAQPTTGSFQLRIARFGQLRAGGCAEPSGNRSRATAWRPRGALSRTVLPGDWLYPGRTLPR